MNQEASNIWQQAYEEQAERHQKAFKEMSDRHSESYGELLERHLALITENGTNVIERIKLSSEVTLLRSRLNTALIGQLITLAGAAAFLLLMANPDPQEVIYEVAKLIFGGILIIGGIELVRWAIRGIREQRARRRVLTTASEKEPGNPGHDAEEGNAHSHKAEGIRQGRTEEAEGVQGARA